MIARRVLLPLALFLFGLALIIGAELIVNVFSICLAQLKRHD
jgi:hypothetical protein